MACHDPRAVVAAPAEIAAESSDAAVVPVESSSRIDALGSLAALMFCAAPMPLFAQSPGTTSEPTLAPVEVRAADEPNATSYQGERTTVGRTPQLPKDIPQSVTVIPGAVIRDQGGDTLRSALRNVPGLTMNAGEGGRIGDSYNVRGFYSFGDLYLDGIRDVAQYNRESFNLEQVDVLRGGASMLFGRGSGGVINQVSKVPLRTDRGSVSATVGTDSYARVTADLNRVLTENLSLRLNLMKTDAGSTRDVVESKREGIAPTLAWRITPNDEFMIGYYYLKTDNTLDYGVPYDNFAPLDVPANRFYGTSSDFERNRTEMLTARYTHRFGPDTEIRTVLRAAEYERDLWGVAPRLNAQSLAATGGILTPNTVINRQRQARGGEESTITSQTDFTTKLQAAGMRHEILAGLELLKEKAGRWSYNAIAGAIAPATTVGNPNPDDALPPSYGNRIRNQQADYDGNSVGVYAQDMIEVLPGWKLLGGVRHDRLDADYTNGAKVDYNENSWRAGILKQPDAFTTYYLSYGDTFNPTADLYQFSTTSAVFPAERSRTIELGAKWDLIDAGLSLRAAIYRATKTWERNTDIDSAGTAQLLSRKRHTDGVEFEVSGAITQAWQVFAGLALMRAEVDDQAPNSNPNYVGLRPRNTPPYTFNLWTTYRVAPGWRVGGGVDAKGFRYAYGATGTGTSPIQPNVVPRYYRVDLMAAYEQPRWAVRLNLLNLQDKRYYDSVYDNGGHVVPAIGRTVLLTGEYKF